MSNKGAIAGRVTVQLRSSGGGEYDLPSREAYYAGTVVKVRGTPHCVVTQAGGVYYIPEVEAGVYWLDITPMPRMYFGWEWAPTTISVKVKPGSLTYARDVWIRTLDENRGLIQGRVMLEGATDHSGTTVNAGYYSDVTNENGYFDIFLKGDRSYKVQFTPHNIDLYETKDYPQLVAVAGIEAPHAESVMLPNVTLKKKPSPISVAPTLPIPPQYSPQVRKNLLYIIKTVEAGGKTLKKHTRASITRKQVKKKRPRATLRRG